MLCELGPTSSRVVVSYSRVLNCKRVIPTDLCKRISAVNILLRIVHEFFRVSSPFESLSQPFGSLL